jgi:glutaredoxin
MKITILATKSCKHRPILEEQLQDSGLQYVTNYFEDHPELVERYQLKRSPVLLVNDEVVSVGMPGQERITQLKNQNTTT